MVFDGRDYSIGLSFILFMNRPGTYHFLTGAKTKSETLYDTIMKVEKS